MILVLDHYDSFTYNLVQMLGTLGARVEVRRHDAIDAAEVEAMAPRGIVLSPGPSHPDRATTSATVLRHVLGLETGAVLCPVLGVCLGHQILARVFGAAVERAPVPVHGKPSRIEHDGRGVFHGVPNPFEAVRYHSLAVVESTLPPELEPTARSADGVLMGLRVRTLPAEGVQFHPESILSPEGGTIMANFLRQTERRDARTAVRHGEGAG